MSYMTSFNMSDTIRASLVCRHFHRLVFQTVTLKQIDIRDPAQPCFLEYDVSNYAVCRSQSKWVNCPYLMFRYGITCICRNFTIMHFLCTVIWES